MRKTKWLVIYPLIFMTFSCSSNLCKSKRLVNPAYCKMQYYHKNLALFPIQKDAITAQGFDQYIASFKLDSIDARSNLASSLYNYIVQLGVREAENINILKTDSILEGKSISLDSSNSFNVDLSLSNKNCPVSFRIPSEDYVKGLGITTDFIATIDSIAFIDTKKSTNRYIAKVKYVVWDYREHDAISYGIKEVNLGSKFGDDFDAWTAAFHQIGHVVLDHKPFGLSLNNNYFFKIDRSRTTADTFKIIRLNGNISKNTVLSQLGILFQGVYTFIGSLKKEEKEKINGRIVFEFTIAPDGKVDSTKIVYSSLGLTMLDNAIKSKFSSITFSPTSKISSTFVIILSIDNSEVASQPRPMYFGPPANQTFPVMPHIPQF